MDFNDNKCSNSSMHFWIFTKYFGETWTLQRMWVLKKLNGVGWLSGRWSSAWEKSTESFTILGGVPVLSLPILRPNVSLRVWDIPALDGASPIRPPGEVVWPMKREPDKKVPVVRTTELAEIGWFPFAKKMINEVKKHNKIISWVFEVYFIGNDWVWV